MHRIAPRRARDAHLMPPATQPAASSAYLVLHQQLWIAATSAAALDSAAKIKRRKPRYIQE
jgi:hypothetical protein